MESSTRQNILIVLGLTVLAAVLRLYQIGFNSIWLDEAFTDAYSSQSLLTIWQKFPTDVHPPLFYWIEHLFIFAFGHSEIALRIFPAICGILTVPVIYLIGKEWIDNETGLVAAFIGAISLFSIFYSQDARMYTLMLLFCSLGLLYWLKWRKDDKNWYLAIATGLFFALATWSHFYAIIMVILLFCIDFPRSFRYIIIWFIGILPLVPALIGMSGQVNEATSGADEIIGQLLWVFGSQNVIGFVGFIAALLIGTAYLYRTEKDITIPFVLIGSLVFIATIGLRSNVAFRYFIWLVPFVSVGMAAGITSLKSRMEYEPIIRMFQIMLSFFIIFGAWFALEDYYTIHEKTDWRGVAEIFGPDDAVYVVPEYNTFPMNYYEKEARVIGITSMLDYITVDPITDGRKFVVVGPGGKDQEVMNWTKGLPIEKRLNGLTIYRISK